MGLGVIFVKEEMKWKGESKCHEVTIGLEGISKSIIVTLEMNLRDA